MCFSICLSHASLCHICHVDSGALLSGAFRDPIADHGPGSLRRHVLDAAGMRCTRGSTSMIPIDTTFGGEEHPFAGYQLCSAGYQAFDPEPPCS